MPRIYIYVGCTQWLVYNSRWSRWSQASWLERLAILVSSDFHLATLPQNQKVRNDWGIIVTTILGLHKHTYTYTHVITPAYVSTHIWMVHKMHTNLICLYMKRKKDTLMASIKFIRISVLWAFHIFLNLFNVSLAYINYT